MSLSSATKRGVVVGAGLVRHGRTTGVSVLAIKAVGPIHVAVHDRSRVRQG